MNKYYLKIPLAILLMFLMIADVSADIDDWWKQSKQFMTDIWDDTTQAISGDKTSPNGKKKDNFFAQVWDDITPTLQKVLRLEKEHEDLPQSAWIFKDKQDSSAEINALLDEAVDVLSVSNTAQTRKHIRLLEEQIREIKQTISEYRQARISAPIRSTWAKTVADYDAKIKELKELIIRNEKRIVELKIQFSQELSDTGLIINTEQVEVLLSSVVGDDIIKSSVVYDNVKKISQQLMKLTINSKEDIEISKRYYGMYTVLLKTLLHMQETFIDNIDDKYLPKIEKIVTDVKELHADTKYLLHNKIDKNHRKLLLANLDAQNLTLKTAALYKKHLIAQRGKMVIAMQKSAADFQIADNTYKTVRVSGELINLLRSSQKSFDLLLNIQVPDLLVFQNLQMKQEFAILTKKLAE
jgi:hypothetical protein